uniref:Polyphosphate kinase (Polyphosphoric acid kinase)) n=1 Tax=Ganoderma boninense TaxID=34458 RepID=A0A5K1JZG5_9APHY|nr:Polyphosphate kinase (EC (ATP-polyphosphate phosphotransferase) (Polyphosphoric acid kinase) [Ganoderma boninense]
MTSAGSADSSHTAVRRPLPPLPEDIIAQVCDEIFATPLYQYSLSRTLPGLPGPYSIHLHFLHGIPLVSKLWWKPATRCLYEHIIIRQVEQIPLLVRTLTSKDAGLDFGTLVRRITLYECIVYPDSDNVDEDVQTIFERCVAVEELSFKSHPDCKDVISEDDKVTISENGANPLWICPNIIFPALGARGPTMLRKLSLVTLRHLKWPEKATTALYNLMLASPRIATLSIQNMELPTDLVSPVLEYLEELTLRLQPYATPPGPRELWTWGFPNLRSLTLLNAIELPTIILKNLGSTLTHLHLCYPITCQALQSALLSELCPVLEHLVLCPRLFTPERLSTAFLVSPESGPPFRRLRYLDVWLRSNAYRRTWGADKATAFVAHARSSFAPALEAVRGLVLLSSSSVPTPEELPTVCHPSALGGPEDTRVVCVCDVPMLQTAWCVRPVDDWWLSR